MGALKRKIQKGIKYYREHGLAAFCAKTVKSITILFQDPYYRLLLQSRLRLALKRRGLLKRAAPDASLPEVILSLTSYPPRIGSVHLAVTTLLTQTYKADRVILWLAQEEFPGKKKDLPERLTRLCSQGLEIRWCDNIRSYKKLIPALESFPEAIIITFDDDLLIDKRRVERLLAAYAARPDCIQSAWASMITYHSPTHIEAEPRKHCPVPTYLNKPGSGAGCLYPPHCFHPDITRRELFMTLAPTNDDLWFWLMGVLNGYRVNMMEHSDSRLVQILYTQEVALWRINKASGAFFVQLENILRHYPALCERLSDEQKRMDELAQGTSSQVQT